MLFGGFASAPTIQNCGRMAADAASSSPTRQLLQDETPVGDDDAASGGHRSEQIPDYQTKWEDGGGRRIILPYAA